MMKLPMENNTRAGIIGGTLLSSIVNIGVEDLITTTILAMIGAIVSFFVSMILKLLFEKVKIRFKK